MKLTKILLILLFFLLPLIHGSIFYNFGIPLRTGVSGNFEFTKSIFFIWATALIFLIFLSESYFTRASISSQEREFKGELWFFWIPEILIFVVLSISTLFSLSTFQSFIGDTEKWHTFALFFSLLILYCILRNFSRDFLKKLIFTSLLSWIFVSIIALKEYFFPAFDYGELRIRALGTFGHPNYLSGFLLLLTPSIFLIEKKFFRYGILWLFILTLFSTKSIWAIIIFCFYICYISCKNTTFVQLPFLKFKGRNLGWIIFGIILLLLSWIIFLYFPEKIHSFLSRFYIWETTLRIIFSQPQRIFFGFGLETLPYYFPSYKVPELYIFENFGFTADRPHNLFLNIFYHFWIIGTSLFLYGIYLLFKYRKSIPDYIFITFLLALGFSLFQYFSVASYVYLTILLAYIYERNSNNSLQSTLQMLFIFWALWLSLFAGIWALKLYKAEIDFASEKLEMAQKIFSHPKYLLALWDYDQAERKEKILSEQNIKIQIQHRENKLELCNTLTQKYPSSENYFFCGNLFKNLEKQEIAKDFYRRWLQKLPDLWDADSPYWVKYFIKNTITGNRFFSPKFWDIAQILEYLEIENNSIQ